MLFRGWIYCYLWYTSILAGYVGLFCPLLPILFVSNKLYRYITDVLFTFWQYYPTALLQYFCGCNIQVSGDPIQSGETSLLVMNHRTRTDWNFLWPTVYHAVVGKNKLLYSTKFVLKDVIKHIPGPGWVMQLACFMYIKRRWEIDKTILQKYVKYVAELNYKHSIILFPEGTDFTENTKRASDRFAEKNNLTKYDYVLHPRTTGFTFLAHQMLSHKCLDAIYDITVIYCDNIPQTEKVLLNGNFPRDIKIHFVRYPSTVLPKSEEGLKEFLEKRWLDKERTIAEYNATGQFLHGQILKHDNPWELYFALVFWTLLPFVSFYLFAFNSFFRAIVIAHTLFLITLNVCFDGFQNFEIALHNLKRNIPFLNLNIL